MTVAIRACQTKRRSMASKARRRFGPISPRRTAGSTTVVTIATPPIQITTASICSARAITTSFIGAVLMYQHVTGRCNVQGNEQVNREARLAGHPHPALARQGITSNQDLSQKRAAHYATHPPGAAWVFHRPFRPGAPRALAGAPTPAHPERVRAGLPAAASPAHRERRSPRSMLPPGPGTMAGGETLPGKSRMLRLAASLRHRPERGGGTAAARNE